jgi:hypothetical protein
MSMKKWVQYISYVVVLWALIIFCFRLLGAPRLSSDKRTIRFSVRQKDDILDAIRDLSKDMSWGPGPNAAAFKGAPFDFISVSDGTGHYLYFRVRYYVLTGTVRIKADNEFRFSEKQVMMELARRMGISDEAEPLLLPATSQIE